MPNGVMLGLWVPHPDDAFVGVECRCDRWGDPMVVLYQKGGVTTDWAWEVDKYPLDPSNDVCEYGFDLDKETARAQAEAIAVRLGYRFPNA